MPSTIRIMSWNIQKLGSSKIDGERGDINGKPREAPYLVQEENVFYSLDYIVSISINYNLDILCIMEVTTQSGKKIMDYLINELDKLAGSKIWKGVASTVQTGGTYEQYVIIWKNQPGILSIEINPEKLPSPAWLYNTVDYQSLYYFFDSLEKTGTEAEQLKRKDDIIDALVSSGYIKPGRRTNAEKKKDAKDKEEEEYDDKSSKSSSRRSRRGKNLVLVQNDNNQPAIAGHSSHISYRLVVDKWKRLKDEGAELVLNDKDGNPLNPPLTSDQLKILKGTLEQIGVILFPNTFSRSPYLLNLTVGDGTTTYPLQLALIHTPGPPAWNSYTTTVDKVVLFPAINNLTLCDPLVNADNLLLAGDFNLSQNDALYGGSKEYSVYLNTKNQWVYKPRGAFIDFDLFERYTNAPLHASDLIGVNTPTSLTTHDYAFRTSSLADSKGTLAPAEYLSEPYDKFFLRSKVITKKDANVVDLIQVMSESNNGQKPKNTYNIYNPDISAAGVKFYKTRYTEEELQAQINFKYESLKRKRNNNDDENPPSKKVLDSTDTVQLKRQEHATIKAENKINEEAAIVEGINVLENAIMELSPGSVTVAPNSGISFFVYRSFSDHLPILAELQIGTSV
jgi:hypothetical protein